MMYMKGCIVSVNLHSLHHDPIYWKDPDVFRPESHLLDDDDGLKSSADHHFLHFSAGTTTTTVSYSPLPHVNIT